MCCYIVCGVARRALFLFVYCLGCGKCLAMKSVVGCAMCCYKFWNYNENKISDLSSNSLKCTAFNQINLKLKINLNYIIFTKFVFSIVLLNRLFA